MERALLEWKGEEKVSWGERVEERQWHNLGGMFFFFFPPLPSPHQPSCGVCEWLLTSWLSYVLRLCTQRSLFFFLSPPLPPAAETVGKQYATPHLPSSKGVCLCEQCTVIRLTKLNPEGHSEISDGYDDEAFWQILQCTPLSAREMEGGDPFRSLMLWSRVWGTAALQSDMLEL